ncbi:hypothetical protein GCM10010508_18030 [Streptomyces naganishii JCM 4654]|uniref:MmyB-like transcription regulator ligand binding domain-containing protein n=1 Tax=Streptomyces naganishii JCM 4654 TaxID=1306179 RepID=A0A918Y204_9ACTN|nr:hypothetical protein GCM10010508_18030 [Streptomyces naganishii JCM 4654]
MYRQYIPAAARRPLDAITAGPAFVRNARMDVLASNQLARAFYSDLHTSPANQANLARFNFLDPASRRFAEPGSASEEGRPAGSPARQTSG